MSYLTVLSIPVMLFLGIVQATILPRLPILGVVPQLGLLVAVAWGLSRDISEGAIWGFAAGFFFDLFSISPLGASALAIMTSVVAITLIHERLPSSRFFLPVGLSALAMLIYLLVYSSILAVLGRSVSIEIASSWLSVILLHGLLILPVYWPIYQVEQFLNPRRVEV